MIIFQSEVIDNEETKAITELDDALEIAIVVIYPSIERIKMLRVLRSLVER